ncbi:MAG: dTMP kinase [Synergistaceae bacterium]|nr:dTMP kinase [Synergistaceae bacterium]
MNDRGIFITLEGIDGCGKSTQAELLCAWLEDTLGKGKVLRTFEPGGWSGGKALRRLLLEEAALTSRTELLLFLADRSGHIDTEISPALQRGRWVVCERYTDSTLAYQSWGRGISFEEMSVLLNWCRFPVPHLTIFLEIDEETAKARLKRRGRTTDRLEAAGDDFMARVACGYKELAERSPDRIVAVNAAPDAEQVAESVREAVEKHLLEKREGQA